jgi:hypothetical protein
VTDYVVPTPEPTAIDETRFAELQIVAGNAGLRGQPSGDERCDNCRYYLEPDRDLSYCWHQKLRVLVGADWWCQWWDNSTDQQQ